MQRRLETRYLDEVADDLDDAVRRCDVAREEGRALSVGVVANAAEALPALLDAGLAVDVVTDQTSAHDPLSYVPAGMSLDEAARAARGATATRTSRAARESMAQHCRAMVAYQDRGAEVFDYGNSLRGEARQGRLRRRVRLPGLRPRVHPPAVLRGARALPLGGA